MVNNTSISKLIEEKRMGVVYILARYFYKVGQPVISDSFYDSIEKFLKENFYDSFKDYLERTYDDDPVPIELLKLLGVKPIYAVPVEGRAELYNYLNEDKSFSIDSAFNYSDAWEYFKMLRNNQLDFVASLKMDGVCTKMLYQDDQFVLSLSRGRDSADSFDYTDNSAKIMPQEIKTGKEIFKITGESYVLPEGLPCLREKYNKPDGYVSGKSSAISMLRVQHDIEDYKYLKTRVFSADGLADTLLNTFQKLEEFGIDVPPYIFIRWEEIPESEEDFHAWVDDTILNPIAKAGEGIPSDGVVIEVNDMNWFGDTYNQYVTRQHALKIAHWAKGFYTSVVRNIIIEQQRVNTSFRVIIDPVVTSDGSTCTYINCYNPSILINADACVGNTIYFERTSNAISCLLYGERLKKALAGQLDE